MGAKVSALDIDEDQAVESMSNISLNNTDKSFTVQQQCLPSLIPCCGSPMTGRTLGVPTPEYTICESSKRMKRTIIDALNDDKENYLPRTSKCLNSKKRKIEPVTSSSPRSTCRVKRAPEKGSYMAHYLKMFDDDFIQDFLWMDGCNKAADNYLLAMVYAYFRRAKLMRREYTRRNFFAALFLAHDMEEDNEDMKIVIFEWALGEDWRDILHHLIQPRDAIFKRMEHRAAVSKATCDEIMALSADHAIWKRVRKPHHGGAIRIYPHEEDELDIRGPDRSPDRCSQCMDQIMDDSTFPESPVFTSGYLTASSLDLPSEFEETTNHANTFSRAIITRKRKESSCEDIRVLKMLSCESEEMLIGHEE